MKKIPFSLVTTCRNEIKSLPRWKQNILDQTRQPNEIVIVDAFSNDGTYEFLVDWSKNDNRIQLIQEKGAAAFGRNLAIKKTKHEHILSTDMGVRLSNNWCEELIVPFEQDDSIEVVAGDTCIDKETLNSPVSFAEYYIEDGGFSHFKPEYVIQNRSASFLKRVWAEVGGLPEDLTFYADDSVFGRQIIQNKYKMAFAPKAMTFWSRPDKFSLYKKEQFNYGYGDGEALIKTPYMVKLMMKGLLPEFAVPTLNGFVKLMKGKPIRIMIKSLSGHNLIVALYVPLLLYSRGYYSSKGYIKGIKNGRENCLECRQRISRDEAGFSVL